MDAGTMFGAVPKVLWSKKCPADADNYMPQATFPMLVRTADKNILIDTGIGNKLSGKQHTIFHMEKPWNLIDELRNFGLGRDDIDIVILTHGDFDHAGGAVMFTASGHLEPTFPKARHIIQQIEWDDISNPNDRAAHTYFPINFEQLVQHDLLEFANGDTTLLPGISLRLTGGHTRGHQIIILQGEKEKAVHLADLLPMHYHLNPLWIMAYDNYPLDVINRKKEYYTEFGESCWFTFYHDPELRACKIDSNLQIIGTI